MSFADIKLFAFKFIATSASVAISANLGAASDSPVIVGQKSNALGLDFWLEVPTTSIVSGDSIPLIMAVSNTLPTSRPFFQRKGAFHDTSIGDFYVVDGHSGAILESPIPFADRRSYTGTKGIEMRPHETIRAEGYLQRTFLLTNAGKYLVYGKARFQSTNWSGQPPGEFIELVTPPVEIEILPSTNVNKTSASIATDVATPPASVGGTRTGAHSPSGLRAPAVPAMEPSPVISETVPSSTTGRRDLTFAALTLLPIVGLIAWIFWRRNRKTG